MKKQVLLNQTKILVCLFLISFLFIQKNYATTAYYSGGSGSWTDANNWVNGIIPQANYDVQIQIISDVIISDVPSIVLNSLAVSGYNTATLTASSSSTININNSAATYDLYLVFGSLTIGQNVKIVMASGSRAYVPGNKILTINSGGEFDLLGTAMLTVSGTIVNNGTVNFNPNGGSTTVVYSGTSNDQNVIPTQYQNLTFSGTYTKILPANQTIYINKVFTPAGTGHTVTNSTVVFNGTVTQNIPAFNGTTGYYNLELNNTTNTYTANTLIPSGNSLYCTNLTIDVLNGLENLGSLNIANNLTIHADANGTGGILQEGTISSIPGTARIEAYFPNQWFHTITSPFTSSSINQFIGFSPTQCYGRYYNPDCFSYTRGNIWRVDQAHTHSVSENDQNALVQPSSTTDTINVMQGYYIYYANSSSPITSGVSASNVTLNNGNINYTVPGRVTNSTDTYHNNEYLNNFGSDCPTTACVHNNCAGGTYSGTGPSNGITLIGNPYPSPMELVAVYLSNDYLLWSDQGGPLSTVIHTYQPTSATEYTFEDYDLSVEESVIIAPMQGFYIQNLTTSNANLYISNVDRLIGNSDLGTPFLKKTSPSKVDCQMLRLSSYISDPNIKTKDKTIIYFRDGSRINTQSEKMFNTDENTPNIYVKNSEKKMSYSTFDGITENLVIPLGFKTQIDGQFTIDLSEKKNLPAGVHVYLEDVITKTIQDLTSNPIYTFNVSEGNGINRFYLRFSLNDQPLSKVTVNANTFGKELRVIYDDPNNRDANLSVYNVNGQQVMSNTKINNGSYNYYLNLPSGIYFVKVIANDKVFNQKVYIQ